MQWDATDVLKRLIAFCFPDRQTVQVFLLSIFVLLSIFSAGFFLNDEMEQGTSFYNLLQGDLTIEEIPEQYYVSQSGVHLNPRFAEYGGHRYIAASHGMSVFSVPFYYSLAAADAVMGVEVFFVVLWSVSLGAFLYLSSGCISRGIQRQWPNAEGVKERVRWLSVAVPVVLLAVNLWLLQPLSFELWGSPIAMQFMSLVFVALGLVVLFRFLRYVFSERLAFFGSFFLLVASPVAFWAIGQKYHGLNFALLVFAFASFCYGKKTERQWYRYGGYVFASLAIWVQLYSGVVILLSLLLVDVVTTKRRRLVNLAAILLVVTLSLGPYFAENYVIYDNPLYPGYIAKGNRNVIPPDPPEITMMSPTSGTYITGTTQVAYNVSGNAEQSTVRFSRDGENWTTLHQTANHTVSFAWDTTNVTEGIGILNVETRNWRNDRATRNVSIVVDNSPPSIDFLHPREYGVAVGNTTLRCDISSDVATVDYWYSDGTGWTWLGNDTTPHDGFPWNTTGLQGVYSLMADATDHVGHRNSSIVRFAVDNSGKHLILTRPYTGSYIGNTATIESVAPPGTTHVRYEYHEDGAWQPLDVDDTPETPYQWNTSGWTYYETALRATAYRDGQKLESTTAAGITIDNRMPAITLVEPSAGTEIRDVAVLSYNTSNNTAYVEVQYSTWNHTWRTAGIDYSASRFAFDTSNVSGRTWLRATAVTRTGKNASATITVEVAEAEKLGALGRLSFIVNSLDVGWEFLKRISAVGEPEDIPGNLYKSFFNARGTEASFAFFVFTPFLILSLFAPLVYLRKKRQFGLIDGLMFAYILFHLFIFVNVSIHQGGGYDMRWYLPLHFPFLYFAFATLDGLIDFKINDIVKAYFGSMLLLTPVLLWLLWLRAYDTPYPPGNLHYFITTIDVLAYAILVPLTLTFIVWVLYKKVSRFNLFRYAPISLIGVSIFIGTAILVWVTIFSFPRGIGGMDNEASLSAVIPIGKILYNIFSRVLH